MADHIQTPYRRVHYLGSAREGTMHFWRQRVTAVANVPLVIGFVVLMVGLVGKPHAQVVATLSSPLIAIMLLLMIASITIHMRIGMQAVIEDYVHGEFVRVVALVANTFFAIVIAGLSGVAVLILALGG